jgi:hypothetical protein
LLVAVLEVVEVELESREMRSVSPAPSQKTFSHDACSDQEHFAVLLVGAWFGCQQVVVFRLELHVPLPKLDQLVRQIHLFQVRLG